MAKSDIPLEKIDLSPTLQNLRSPEYAEDRQINAFDTETSDGDIFMISRKLGDKEAQVLSLEHSDGFYDISPESALDFITPNESRGAVNVWFNLDFDVSVILNFLPAHKKNELRVTKETTWGKWVISYLKSKFLSLRDNNNHVYRYYDISQFFFGSLEQTAENWSDSYQKLDTVDTSKFSDRDYVFDNFQKIKKYAKYDVIVTQDIWQQFTKLMENELDVPMLKPYSTGYISEMYMHKRLDEKPQFHPESGKVKFHPRYCKNAWKSYHGGRFEVFRKGYFSDVIGLDINSAYPNVMSQLPDPSTMQLQVVKNPSISDIRNADYGFVKMQVTTDESKNIQPFAFKTDTLKFPRLVDKEVSTFRENFLYALDNGYLDIFELKEAELYYEKPETAYPFSFLQDLYDERLRYKDKIQEKGDKYDRLQFCLKVVINSMYGKTLQINDRLERVNYQESKVTFHENGDISIPSGERVTEDMWVTDPYDKDYLVIKKPKSGSFFNPFISSYITGKTRLQLLKAVDEMGMHEDIIMFATDCIMLPDMPKSKYKHLLGDKLGQWDFDYRGSAFVIGAGVYDVFGENTEKIVSRGYTKKELPTSLREMASRNWKTLPIEIHRPYSLFEELQRNDVKAGKFDNHIKKIDVGMDKGREWPNYLRFPDLLTDNYYSNPIELSSNEENTEI